MKNGAWQCKHGASSFWPSVDFVLDAWMYGRVDACSKEEKKI